MWIINMKINWRDELWSQLENGFVDLANESKIEFPVWFLNMHELIDASHWKKLNWLEEGNSENLNYIHVSTYMSWCVIYAY